MKTVLLYANPDAGLESRLQAALGLVRAFEGHLVCLQVTPYDAFIMGDPFGGIYALPTVIEQVQRAANEHQGLVERRLSDEGVSWEWLRFDGAPGPLIVDCGRLADLIVLTLPGAAPPEGAQEIAADVLVHARSPVLAVPPAGPGLEGEGAIMVAWDGSLESSHALRLNLPMLKRAAAVYVVTVTGGHVEFAADDAVAYLARHGIETEPHDWPASGRTVAAALLDAAASLSAVAIVMGAYGHTRLREAVLGGATRDMLQSSRLPLLMAH